MADINDQIASMSEALENATNSLNEFGVMINNGGTNLRNSVIATDREISQIAKANAQKRDEILRGGVVQLTSTMKDLASNFTQSKGSFTALNPVIDLTTKVIGGLASKIPIVGGLLQGMAEGAGEAMKFLTAEFERAYTTFESLSGTGVLQSFEDLQKGSQELGLNFADQQRVLGSFSKDLALFGGSAIAGRQEFQKIAVQSEEARRNFQKLGISAAEFSEFQLSYIAQQTRLGLGQSKTTAQLAEGSQQYIRELDLLSKATGLQRKDIQAQRDAALSETKFRAALGQMENKTAVERMIQLNSLIQSASTNLAQGFRDLTSGAVTSDAAKSLVLKSGGVAQTIIEQMKKGTIDQYEGFRRLADAVDKTTLQFEGVAQFTGDANTVTQHYAEARELANRKELTPEQLQKLRDENLKTLENEKGQNAELAKSRQALYQTTINMESLVTSSDLATKAINFMAEAVEAISEKMYEYSGQEMPPLLKAKKEERQALQEEKKAREALEKAISDEESGYRDYAFSEPMGGVFASAGLGSVKALAEKELAEKSAVLQQKRSARMALSPTPPSTSMTPAASTSLAERIIQAESGGKNIANQSGPGGQATSSAFGLAQFTKGTFEGLVKGASPTNPLFGKTFEDYKKDTNLQREALNQLMDTNRSILASNKVSTSDAAIYLAHFLGPYGATKVLKLPDTAPLTEAVSEKQIEANPMLRSMQKIADIKEWANKKMGGGGYPTPAKNGAIVPPRPGGSLYQVGEAGQSEAIIPMPDGRSVPVTFKNSNEQSNILISSFDKMSNKLDTMIDILNRSTKIQSNIVRNTA